MTVFYEIAMCMLRSIFHKLLCISTFFYGALYMNCVQHFFLAFLNIAILAAFSVLIISSTKVNGAFS